MQIKKELAEMHDGRVQLISLVETGANAAPFKRLKSEEPEGGIDVFRAEKLKAGAEDVPQLIALAVSPKGDVEAAKTLAKAAGIEIQETREVEGDDGTTTLLLARKQDRVNTADPKQVQVQLDDDLIAVCRVEKMFMPFHGETSFSEAIKAQGFFPQLHNALDVFHDVAFSILDSVDSPKEAAVKIKESGDELVSLLTLMTKALPKETFKMAEVLNLLKSGDNKELAEGGETLVSKEIEGGDGAGIKAKADAEKAETEKAEAEKVKAEAEAKAKADAEGTDTLASKDVHEDEEEDEKGKKKKKPAKKEDEESDLPKVLKAIGGLSETVEKQGEAQGELKKQIETVAAKADEAGEAATAAAKKADETDEAVTGRVSNPPAEDGKSRTDTVVSKGGPPLMDTGMARYHARGGAN